MRPQASVVVTCSKINEGPDSISSKFGLGPLKNEEKQGRYLNFSQFSEYLRAEKRHGVVAAAV